MIPCFGTKRKTSTRLLRQTPAYTGLFRALTEQRKASRKSPEKALSMRWVQGGGVRCNTIRNEIIAQIILSEFDQGICQAYTNPCQI